MDSTRGSARAPKNASSPAASNGGRNGSRSTSVPAAGAARPPAGLGAQRARRHPVHLAHRVVELPDAGEPGRERHVGHAERGRLDQQPGGVRPVRPGQRERSGAELGGEHPVQVPLGVAERGGQPGHAVALDQPVGDQPHGAGGQVGADVPLRRAGHGVGPAAPAGPVAALLGGAGGGQELDVAALAAWWPGRTAGSRSRWCAPR